MGYESVGIVSRIREVAVAYGEAVEVVCVRRGLPIEEVERQCRRAQREGEVGHYRLAVLLADMATRGLHQLVGCSSTVHFARARLGMSRRQARDLVAVGEALTELPLIDEAFRDGWIGWTKVRILCRVASAENERAWLELSLGLSSDALERRCAGAEKGRPPREDGRGLPSVRLALRLKLDPLTYETWELAKKRCAELAGEAVAESEVLAAVLRSWLAVEHGEGGTEAPGAAPFKVVIGLDRGGDGAWVATDDGPAAIDRAIAESAACDAPEILAATADGGLHADPDSKTPPALRQRVLARDSYRCLHCQSRLSVSVHHIVFRSHGGKTIPANLATLCLRCHTLVHEGLLVVTGTAPRGLRFTDRHGASTTAIVRVLSAAGKSRRVSTTRRGAVGRR